MNWASLGQWSYWLDGFLTDRGPFYPVPMSMLSWSFNAYLIIILLVTAFASAALLFKTWSPANHPLSTRLSTLGTHLVVISCLWMVWFVARIVSVGFVSSRLVSLSIALYLVGVIIWFGYYLVTFFPVEWAYYKKNRA